jgi:hypothetical protein
MDRIVVYIIVAVTLITMLDIAASTAVRIYADAVPVVAGDVAKVGVGILGGIVMGYRWRP